MKIFSSFFKKANENAKNARPSVLRVESLESRQLLSVTDLGSLAGVADCAQVEDVADEIDQEPVDLSSMDVVLAAPSVGYNSDDLAVVNAFNIDPDSDACTWNDAGRLTSLKVDGFSGRQASVSGCSALTELEFSNCGSLLGLLADNNSLTSLKVSNCPKLSSIDCGGNALEALEVTGCEKLSQLVCDDNGLTSLDVSPFSSLTTLTCGNNPLESLDVSGLNNLTQLSCEWTQLTTLDLSANTKLTKVACYSPSLNALFLNQSGDLECCFQRQDGGVDQWARAVATDGAGTEKKDAGDSKEAVFMFNPTTVNPVTVEFFKTSTDTEAFQKVVVNPMLYPGEGSVKNIDENVELADVRSYQFTPDSYEVTINGEATDSVAVVNGKLVYVGGLTSSEVPYEVQVVASLGNVVATGEFALTVEKATLDAPTNVTLNLETPYSIGVSFDSVEYADSYLVAYSKDADFEEYSLTECSSDGATIDSLDPNTTYYVKVMAVGEDMNDSEWSETVSATTESDVEVITPPNLVKINWATNSSLNVSYQDPAFVRGVKKYYVEYSKDADFSTIAGSKLFTQPGVGRIGNLSPGTTYYFRVKTVTADGESVWSEALSGATLGVCLPTPTVNKAGWATETSINVSYSDDAFERGVIHYVVEYSKYEDFSSVAGTKTFTQPGIGRIAGLDSDTTYYFRVKAVSASDESEWSDAVYSSTLSSTVDIVL